MAIQIESDTLTTININKKTVYLLGTAHISSQSVNEVVNIMHERQPDHVCVEIDEGRYTVMKEGQSWKNLNIGKVLKQGRGFFMLATLALSAFQRRMGQQSGSTPGEEMRVAIEAAEESGIPFSFCDRNIQTTLRRAWKKSSFWNRLKMTAVLIASAFSNEKLTPEEVEALKNRSALQNMMQELARELPSAKEVLIDERDRYLAANIFNSSGERTLAVIGAGHADGIIKYLESFERGEASTDIQDLDAVPESKSFIKAIPWVIPFIVISLMVYGFVNSGWEQGLEMFFYWFTVNGILSGIGAILALSHPITIVASILLAPFTSLNPTIGVGIISGGIEAYLRKPRVIDFEKINEDILSLKGFYRNRVTHALIVFFLTSIGSAIGTFVAFPLLASLI